MSRLLASCVLGLILLYCIEGQASMCKDTHYNLSLGSIHVNPNSKMNGINPGIGVECGQYQAGVYHNSIEKVSVYVGRVVEGNPYTGIKYGVVSGYLIPIVPYITGYIRIYSVELTIILPTEYNPLTIGYSIRWK